MANINSSYGALAFLLFVAIYLPGFRFIPISPEYLLIGFFVVYYLFRPGVIAMAVRKKAILGFFLTLMFLILYSFFVHHYHGRTLEIDNTRFYYVKQIRLFVNAFFLCLGIAIVLYRSGWTVNRLLNCYLYIAILQSIIALAMFLVPAFRDFILMKVLSLDFLFDAKEDRLTNRVYGISSEYLFAFPLFQGFALAILFGKLIDGRLKYLFALPLIMFSILFNARIGFIGLPIICLVYLLYLLRSKRTLPKFIKYSILTGSLFLFVFSLFFLLSDYFQVTLIMDELFRGISDDGVGKNHFENLFDAMIILPESLSGYLFGEGRYLYQNALDVKSDIGYINDLMFGGIVYILFIIGAFYKLAKFNIRFSSNLFYKVLSVTAFCMLLVANYKGPIFANNAFIRSLLILFFLFILTKNKNNVSLYHNSNI